MCLTADSPADLADLRRQKTVSANVSAKADAADNRRERQLAHSGMQFMFIQQICKGTRLLFFAHSLPFPYSFLVLSFLALSLLVPYVIQTAVLTESKCRNKRKTAEYRLQSSISSQENVPKGTQKKDKKVPAKLCAEEACLLCHDEGTYSKKNSLA